ERQGYRIRARNYHCPGGELDLVAEREQTLCFVEVRMRSSGAWGDPSHTVSWKKQRRVVRAAERFLFEQGLRADQWEVRFDVFSVVGRGADARIEHIPHAFDAGH